MNIKIILCFILFASVSAFADDFSINGVLFNEASLYTHHKEYRGSKYSAACELIIFLTKNKSVFSRSVISKNDRKATCSDLSSATIARFVSPNSPNALSILLMNLGNRKWIENREDMSADSESNKLICKIYVDQIQDTALNNLCYNASQTNKIFSTRE